MQALRRAQTGAQLPSADADTARNGRTGEDDPAEATPDVATQQRATYELFILSVTLIALLVVGIKYITSFRPEVDQVLTRVDGLCALIILFDYFVRVRRAPHRLRYVFGIGVFDLLGSLPTVGLFRLFRLPRVVLQFRYLRRESPRSVLLAARKNLAQSTLLGVALVVLLVVMFGSIAILVVEDGAPAANILTGDDAIWWSLVTIATVGYGDRVPVTIEGRMIGVLMIFMGVSVFSVLTSYIASAFVRRGDNIEQQLQAVQSELAEIKQLLAAQGPSASAEEPPDPHPSSPAPAASSPVAGTPHAP
jgi:voltage-gated potassium channel